MATIARITDGTTTVDLIWHSTANTKYRLERDGWAPAVAPLSLSDLGGGGTYESVDEEIALDVYGTSAAAALANLDTLNTLLDQAERFWRLNQVVSPVKLQFSPNGSTAGPLQCLIRGRAKGDESAGLSLDVKALSAIKGFRIPVRIRLARNGLLLANTETATSASGSVGDLLTTTMPSTAAHASPIDAQITGFGDFDVGQPFPDMFFLFAPSSSLINIQEAEAMATGAFTSVADGNGCRGAAVLRYTPAGTTLVGSASSSGMTMAAKTIAFFAMVRNNSATTSFDINVAMSAGTHAKRTAPVTIDTSSLLPRAVALGIIAHDNELSGESYGLEIAASAASGTLDIDAIYALGINDETSAAVQVTGFDLSTGSGFSLFTDMSIRIASEVLTATEPSVKWREGTTATERGRLQYDYDPFLMSKGATVYCAVLAPGGPGGTNRWRYSTSAPAVETVALQVTRYPAYPVPR